MQIAWVSPVYPKSRHAQAARVGMSLPSNSTRRRDMMAPAIERRLRSQPLSTTQLWPRQNLMVCS